MAASSKRHRRRAPRKEVDYDAVWPYDDRPTRHRLSPSTLKSAKRAWKKWEEYCSERQTDPQAPLTLPLVKRFVHWYINHSDVQALNSAFIVLRQWRQAYVIKTGREIDPAMKSEMANYITSDICRDFELTQTGRDKKVMNVDDLLAILHHHWTACDSWFPTERYRVQVALLLLLVAYTGVRPSAILEVTRDRALEEAAVGDDPDFMVSLRDPDCRVDSLKYKDIELFKVKDPRGADEHVFLMLITFRLMKGHRNTGLPHKIVFHERDDNLAFCPILHVLSLAFADKAFKCDWLQRPDDLFRFQVQTERGLQGIPLEWRDDMLETPILRRISPQADPTAPYQAWTYEEARNSIVRLGKTAGMKDLLSLYSSRRGFGEAVDKRATTAVRNRAMGHSRGEIFDRFYTNQVIPVDTVSAFLGTASEDWAINIATHMSLTRDPFALQRVAEPTASAIQADAEVSQLEHEVAVLRQALFCKFRSVRAAKGSDLGRRYNQVSTELRATKRRVKRKLYDLEWQAYFASIGTAEIERQRTAEKTFAPPSLTGFDLEERTLLASLLCRNDDVETLLRDTVHRRRIEALNAMTNLCGRRLRNQISSSKDWHTTTETEQPLSSGEKLFESLQCPWCFNDPALPSNHRSFRYAQLKSLRHHIEQTHMPRVEERTVRPLDIVLTLPLFCPLTSCGLQADGDQHMRNHLATSHGFFCSPNIRSYMPMEDASCKMGKDEEWLDMVNL